MPEVRARPRRREATRAEVLSFLAGLAFCARETRAAEGYLGELLVHVTFEKDATR